MTHSSYERNAILYNLLLLAIRRALLMCSDSRTSQPTCPHIKEKTIAPRQILSRAAPLPGIPSRHHPAKALPSLGFEQQNRNVSKIEIDEMFRLWIDMSVHGLDGAHPEHFRTVRDEASKVSAHYAMPCGALFGIELPEHQERCDTPMPWTDLSFDILRNVLYAGQYCTRTIALSLSYLLDTELLHCFLR